MNKKPSQTNVTRTAYREAGLVQLSTWVPPEERDRLVRECRQLREIYLAKLVLQQAKETGLHNEEPT